MNTQYKEQAEFLHERFQDAIKEELGDIKTKLYEIEHRFIDESLRGVPIELLFQALQRQLDTADSELRHLNKRLYEITTSSNNGITS